jgi:AraC-like DNA-binding protein
VFKSRTLGQLPALIWPSTFTSLATSCLRLRSRMQVVALVGALQAARITRALSPTDRFIHVKGWDSLFHHLTNSDGSAVVLNPHFADCAGRDSYSRPTAVDRLRIVPFVVYVRPADLRSAMAFVRGGAIDVILEGHTDSCIEIQAALRSTQTSSGELILHHVIDALSHKHAKAAVLFTSLFRSPGRVANAAALTHGTIVSTRTLYRAVTDAGLAPVGVIVKAARAARAFDLIRHRRLSLEGVAHELGYSSARRLSSHLRQITGLPSVAECASLPQNQFVSAVLRELFRSATVRAG